MPRILGWGFGALVLFYVYQCGIHSSLTSTTLPILPSIWTSTVASGMSLVTKTTVWGQMGKLPMLTRLAIPDLLDSLPQKLSALFRIYDKIRNPTSFISTHANFNYFALAPNIHQNISIGLKEDNPHLLHSFPMADKEQELRRMSLA
jgi:hypothetical protein